MSLIHRGTDIRAALRARQRGFLLNPFRFGSGASWTSVWEPTGGGLTDTSTGYTLRTNIPTANLIAGTELRVSFRAGSSGMTIGDAFVGIRNSGYTFLAAPTRIKFAGANSAAVAANADLVSDAVALPGGGTSPLLVSIYLSAGGEYVWNAVGGAYAFYYRAGNFASENPGSAFGVGGGGGATFIRRVEVR